MSDFLSIIFREEFLSTVIRVAVPLLFASLSVYIASVSGLFNIAVEGIMLMSALMAVLGSFWTQSALMGLLIAILTGIIMTLLLAFMTMKLKADALLVGIALNIFAASFTVFLLYLFTGSKGASATLASKTLPIVSIPILKEIPVIRTFFSDQYVLTYVCYICVIVIGILVYKTKFGLRLKAAGINPDSARSVGINVNKYRLTAIIISGLLASLGGAYMTMGYLSAFTSGMVAGRGWIGFAAQAMGGSNLLGVSLTTLVFALFQAFVAEFSWLNISSDLLTTVPYFGVLIGITAFSVVKYYKAKKGVHSS